MDDTAVAHQYVIYNVVATRWPARAADSHVADVRFNFRHSSDMTDGHSTKLAYKHICKDLWQSYGMNISISSNVNTRDIVVRFRDEQDFLSFMMAHS